MSIFQEIEALEKEACIDGIEVNKVAFLQTKKSYSFNDNGYRHIAINTAGINSLVDEKITLAHEISHFQTNTLSYITSGINTQKEVEKRRYGEAINKRHYAQKLAPLSRILKCFDMGKSELWEIDRKSVV